MVDFPTRRTHFPSQSTPPRPASCGDEGGGRGVGEWGGRESRGGRGGGGCGEVSGEGEKGLRRDGEKGLMWKLQKEEGADDEMRGKVKWWRNNEEGGRVRTLVKE